MLNVAPVFVIDPTDDPLTYKSQNVVAASPDGVVLNVVARSSIAVDGDTAGTVGPTVSISNVTDPDVLTVLPLSRART